ncbi:hypothetical protein PRIPAC_88634 [Pristionchus pacificus]|uniref:Cytochrome P450 n=1 Tax=Pristionchus pacificus TaxID=54126 RepID=A0A2A6CWQ9_PRIPA|nr:hypothetical protein PRIPAC_88634 [Pristionchus pacificus]|eukprot:PDM82674.1 cytochrome P450 [Pristionchus pacificus]
MLVFVLALIVILAYGPMLIRFLRSIHHMKSLSKRIPGDEGLPVLGHMLEVGDSLEYVKELRRRCSKSNGLIKLWMLSDNEYTPTNGEMLKHIVDSSEEITKGANYGIIEKWLGQGVLISTGTRWHAKRKMLSPMFHFKMLESYIETMNRQAKICADLLEEKCGHEVDMYRTVKLCALDIICETAMGKDLEAQRNPHQEYIEAIDKIMELDMKIGFTPFLWVGFIRKLLGVEEEFNRNVKVAHEFTKTVLRERSAAIEKGEETNKRSFIDMLLMEREKAHLTDTDVREEVDTFMFAGHDTTSSVFSWTLWCLACHPKIQEKVHEEIDGVFRDDPDRECTKEDFGSLNYLDRCIKEAERLFPPVPAVHRQLQNDMQMGDNLLPRGASVSIAPIVIHHNESIYPNPTVYDPDRFLPENVATRHAYDFIPFSAGPRNCIGQKFAQYEIKIVMSWLLRRFRFVTDRPLESQKYSVEATLKPVNGMRITVVKR